MHSPSIYAIASSTLIPSVTSFCTLPNPSNGCGKPLPNALLPGGPSINFTLTSPLGGGERKYLLHLPEAFSVKNDIPAPVILAFGGFTQPTWSMEEMTQFSDPNMNKDYIAVYPEGLNNVWLGDPGAPNSSTVDDRPFISDLLDVLEKSLCIDKSRIYTTGLSNGGGLSGLIACSPSLSRRIAAFSGVSAAYYTTESLGYSLFEEEACQPGGLTRKIPYLHIHGDKDMVIAYNGDNSYFDIDENGIPDPDTLPVPRWLNDWAIRNGCPAGTDNKTSVQENGTVAKTTWSCGGRNEVVTGYYVEGLGHGWPSTTPEDERLEAFRLGPTTWNASTVLMEWFDQWNVPAEEKG
ncbi:Alpha/Beta hydrolase protein [Clohesyomyces aquaticus]|uniref:feruloyl esterase n=1 Tax=Clohesyomyces aquaticus TaxID=1231657 RepID=A0A1Y1ZZ24_9PLEO|nr:Alpha/Beta hydrolase protein [Clohesyomyces aquaticus]